MYSAPRSQKMMLDSPRAGVTGGCGPPSMGAWELNSGPLQEQHVLWTTENYLSSPKPRFAKH